MAFGAMLGLKQKFAFPWISRLVDIADEIKIGQQVDHILLADSGKAQLRVLHSLPHLGAVAPHLGHSSHGIPTVCGSRGQVGADLGASSKERMAGVATQASE